ncbi:hypothetical protein C1645_839950 [Glomus cerebriforme]|uniref:Uncharacterized protein n=1 Tax=Glomus cerebriforme TaxID=658196 RepID=A0A397S4Y3_9GLOM|nr:hypothetical protein C1645_839950 [Glomus cerebriforme]
MSIVISEALEEPYFKFKSDVPLTESYRIKVKFDNREKVLEFCVSLKTTAWYDVFLKGKSNAIKIAQNYIINAEEQFPPEPTKTNVNIKDEDDELDFDMFVIYFKRKLNK